MLQGVKGIDSLKDPDGLDGRFDAGNDKRLILQPVLLVSNRHPVESSNRNKMEVSDWLQTTSNLTSESTQPRTTWSTAATTSANRTRLMIRETQKPAANRKFTGKWPARWTHFRSEVLHDELTPSTIARSTSRFVSSLPQRLVLSSRRILFTQEVIITREQGYL